MNVYVKLNAVQTALKAPKNQRNTFGGYNYRSCEDILEALKPLLFEYKSALIINDEIISVGEKIYIKATAKFIDCENSECVEVSALAREPENKKGMDDSQITGATSSYARKYALNGLFAIDDTKDADFLNTHGNEAKRGLSVAQIAEIERLLKETNTDRAQFLAYFNSQNVAGVDFQRAKTLLLKKLEKAKEPKPAEPILTEQEKDDLNAEIAKIAEAGEGEPKPTPRDELFKLLRENGAKLAEARKIVNSKNEAQIIEVLAACKKDPNTISAIIEETRI